MTETQNTPDQIRSEMKEKTAKFAEEANSKKEAIIDVLSGVETDEDAKKIGHKAKVKLAKDFREDNKDEISEYKSLGKEIRLKELEIEKLRVATEKLLLKNNSYFDIKSHKIDDNISIISGANYHRGYDPKIKSISLSVLQKGKKGAHKIYRDANVNTRPKDSESYGSVSFGDKIENKEKIVIPIKIQYGIKVYGGFGSGKLHTDNFNIEIKKENSSVKVIDRNHQRVKHRDKNEQKIRDIAADFLVLLKNENNYNMSTIGKLIQMGGGKYVINNISKLKQKDYDNIASYFIDFGFGDVLIDNLDKFEGLDNAEIADKLIAAGYERLVAENPENFKGLDNAEIADKLIAAGYERLVAENLEIFKGLNKDTIIKLEKLDLSVLEKENFRIDSTNWRAIISPGGVKVKVNSKGDVRELLEGKYRGEQLFNRESAIRETKAAGKKLPSSYKVFDNIIEQRYKGDYQAFLLGEKYKDKDGNKTIKFSGWRDTYNAAFWVDGEFHIWCENGSSFKGSNDKPGHSNGNYNFGYSVRCVKEAEDKNLGKKDSNIEKKEERENINEEGKMQTESIVVPTDNSHIGSHLNNLSLDDVISITKTKRILAEIKKMLEENKDINKKRELFLFEKAEEIYKKDGLFGRDLLEKVGKLLLKENGEFDWKDYKNTEFCNIWFPDTSSSDDRAEVIRDHKKLFYLKAITCEKIKRGDEEQIIEGEDKDKGGRLYTNLIHNKDNRHLSHLIEYVKSQSDYKENLQLNYADELGIPKEYQFNTRKDVDVEGQEIKVIAQGFFDKNTHRQSTADKRMRSNGKYIVGEKNGEKYFIYDNGMSEHRFIAEKNDIDKVIGGGWMTINSDGIEIYDESYVYGEDPYQESGFTKKVFENILKK